jgi:hypothetical protein
MLLFRSNFKNTPGKEWALSLVSNTVAMEALEAPLPFL